ncbi:hypothetical protein C365_06113 [Cryptococcus neoformans Bt85]|nr:hypothetical protein C365_06113 [Cryptococcus neoformans var. grubii Bt85]
MAPTSRSKASMKGRPQPKHGKKTAVRPSRLLTRRRPTFRATSPESIGEQIEVQLEGHSTPEAPPSPGESSICSFFFANHSSPSRAHNERRPSPAGSGSIYEASQASEPPEGYTDINNAALKAVLDAHITPCTQLPETVRAELMDSTCPGAVISAGFSMDWNLDAYSGGMANPALGSG